MKSDTTMQKFFAVIGMVVTLGLAVGMSRVAVNFWWPAAPDQISEAQAAAQATAPDAPEVSQREMLMRGIMWVRATLPRKIDDHTTLVAVGLEGNTYWSHLVLDRDADDVSGKEKADIQRVATVDACRRLRAVIQGGTIAVYRADYVDRSRKPVQTVEIRRDDCQ
jgi:hypothetical protein